MNTDVKAIFEQSRTLENLEGAAVLMRSLDKAPSSLRALSDFVTKARKSGNTEQFEEADIGRNNVFAVSPYPQKIKAIEADIADCPVEKVLSELSKGRSYLPCHILTV